MTDAGNELSNVVESGENLIADAVECGGFVSPCVCSDVPADDEEYQAKAGEDAS